MRAAGHRVAAAFGYETLVDLALSRPHERRYLRAAIPLWVLGRDKKKLRAALLKHPVNPTHHFWRMLAGPARCPFVKVELLLRNPGRLPGVAGWPTLVPATSPCPPALLASHLLVKGGVDDGAWPARRAADAAPLPTLALRRRCLIIAELSIPQCRKYRVDQKAEMFRLLDTDCTILSWRDTERAANLLQTHSIVIFYRVPATAAVRRLIAEAQCLGLSVWFEIDDLVFDPEDYSQNPNLKQLPAQEVRGLLQGVEAYRQALALCRNAIASTAVLAERMRAVGQGNVLVVENALDSETLTLIEGLRPRAADGRIRLFYGSGTRTHDSDFALIAPALLRVAHRHPTMDIVLMGELALPPDLAALGERVRRLPGKPYGEYLALLAEADITVAPLVPGAFNDSKSNIKFLEAAMAGVPAVCSPRSAFAQVIEHGRTGFLAEGEEEWFDALDALAADPALRARLANAAREAVLRRYEPAVVARQQLAPLLHSGPARSDPRLHVLMVNAFFAPQTFGGATVLMEALARQLQARGDTRVSIFTTAPSGKVPLHGLQRESQDGMTVFRLGVQDQPNWTDVYWSDSFAELFREALRALAPDAVHIHCVQGIGGALVAACRAEGIPVAITLHDAWWLCQRQFLVTEQGRYCGQWRIDPKQCAACVDAPVEDRDRDQRLRGALTAADLLLAPSEHWRRFHIDNGVSPARIVTNTNGILVPRNAAPNDGPARLRFGFVGGAEPVKGYPLIRRVFQTLPRGDWELVLVNPEGAPARQHAWRANGRVRHVPPYQPTSADMFFSNIDVLLFPSQWPESFGLTVREALARHKWVIATDAGGQAEAVIPGVNGTLIPLGDDPEPLRHAVEALLNRQPELRGWHNPMAGSIRSVDDQTEELHSVLLGLTRIPHAATPSP